MNGSKTTESDSNYQHLDKMSVFEILQNINQEDKSVPLAIEKKLKDIGKIIPLLA